MPVGLWRMTILLLLPPSRFIALTQPKASNRFAVPRRVNPKAWSRLRPSIATNIISPSLTFSSRHHRLTSAAYGHHYCLAGPTWWVITALAHNASPKVPPRCPRPRLACALLLCRCHRHPCY
jgi:hypothetical protein